MIRYVLCAAPVLLVVAGCGSGFGGGGGSAAMGSSSTVSGTTSSAITASSTIPNNVTLRQLVIETDGLTISQSGGTQQLQCSGVFSDGHVRDLTHVATWTLQDKTVASLDSHGIVSPVAAGTTGLVAAYSGLTAQGTLVVAASAVPTGTTTTTPSGPTWDSDVFPLFQSSLACNSCHAPGGIGTVGGRMILTGTSATDFSQLTTSGLIDTTNPSSSVLLMKATNTTTHTGGAQFSVGSGPYTTILGWIAAGAPKSAQVTAPTPMPSTAPDALVVSPAVRNLVDAGTQQQVVVLAWWKSTGAVLDVTRSATFAPSVAGATIDSFGVLECSTQATVTLGVTFMNVQGSGELAFDKTAPLAQGDMPNVIVLPGAQQQTPAPSTPAPSTPAPSPTPSPAGSTSTPASPSTSASATTYSKAIQADLAICTTCHSHNALNPQTPFLETFSDVQSNAVQLPNLLEAGGFLGTMAIKSGMSVPTATHVVNDINAWIAAGYPQ